MKELAIIIPAYKSTYLQFALDSLASQTCKDFTVYIGDDCSPYDLKSIVDDFLEEIDIVYHRFDTNVGGKDLVAQWERCISLSKGEPYLWLFSDDDIMQPRCVESYLNLQNDIRDNYLVHFDIGIIDEFNSGNIDYLPEYPQILTAKDYLDQKLQGKIVSYVVEFVFSRKIYLKSNGFLNFDLAWGADFMTWLKFANCCNGIYNISVPGSKVLWRRSNENISPDKSYSILKRKINSLIENAAYIRHFLSNNGFVPSFKYAKFVWGEIRRNRKRFNSNDLSEFGRIFREKVGFPLWAYASEILIKIMNVR